jgi:hypothetical protein
VACVEDKCWDKGKHQAKTCSGHGNCNARNGACRCGPGYSGHDCEGGAPTFAGSRIITQPWSDTLDGWFPPKVQGKKWALCFSSFLDKTDVSVFHAQCDQHSTTLTVANSSSLYTFGGYVRTGSDFSIRRFISRLF